MRAKLIHKILQLAILCGAALLLLTLTDPNKLPSVALIVPFVLFVLILYFAVMALLEYLRGEDDVDGGLHVVRPRIIAALVAGFPILLLILQSIGQLSLRDVLTVGAISVLTYFYTGKFSARTSNR